MSKTQIFIEKARAVHGDRYSYDLVDYVRSKDKVIITCAKHSDFEQTPSDHLRGYGCSRCGNESMAVKKSQEAKDNFVEKARDKHGNLYDYDRVAYVRARNKVTITCKRHGDFQQTPNHHLKGYGCVKCGFESMAIKQAQEAKDGFIEKARAVHGDRYDYSETVYVIHSEKVIITCAKHGAFEQTPNVHLNDHGCPTCPARHDQPTNLYLMYNGLGKVKVGYAIDLNRRITELNRDAPFKAELLETWTLPDTPTVRKIESKVHRKLAKYHAGLTGFDGATEWFNTTHARARDVILETLKSQSVIDHVVYDSAQPALFSKVRC